MLYDDVTTCVLATEQWDRWATVVWVPLATELWDQRATVVCVQMANELSTVVLTMKVEVEVLHTKLFLDNLLQS